MQEELAFPINEEPYPPREVIDFLNFVEYENSLEQRLRHLFQEERIDEACDVVLTNADKVISLTGNFIPERSMPELHAQARFNWPGGSGIYYGDNDRKIKEKFRERWNDEEEVLNAKNPRRVKRLWENSKGRFEERYHRGFSDRTNLAVMFGIDHKKRDVEENLQELREVLPYRERFNDLVRAEPNSGWEESRKLWDEGVVFGRIKHAAESLVELAQDMIDSRKLFSDEYAGLTPINMDGHRVEFPGIGDMMYPDFAMHLASLFVEHKQGTLSFSRAINLLNPDIAKQAGIDTGGCRGSYPEEIVEIFNRTLKLRYEHREQWDEASRFMEWYAGKTLERWKATAIDHERLFDYHDPHFIDKRFMSVFWSIREGRNFNQYSEEHYHRRFPGVLRAMIEDGLITEKQIDPPLKERYLTPDEVLAASNTMGSQEDKPSVHLTMHRKPAIIASSAETRRLLPADENARLPVPLQTDLSQLPGVLDPSRDYFVVYKGNHTLFIAGEKYFPNGDQAIGDVHRITLLPEGVNPQEGAALTIAGQRFNIVRQRSLSALKNLEEALYDVEVDVAPVHSYVVVVDVSPEEFREKYFHDFMAHACLHRHHLNLDGLLKDLERIDNFKTTGFQISMGETGRSSLRTFELHGRFGFQLKEENYPMASEVPFIAKTLISYLSDVGLPLYTEADLDESGRHMIKRKLEDRAFSQEHFQGIVEGLQEHGLPRLLSYALTDKKYSFYSFGECRKPCETCGENYIGGNIYRPDLGEQWCEGVRGEDLHALAKHPATFRFKFGNLRNIHRILNEAKEYTPPFLEFPELMPELTDFAKTYQSYVKARGEAYAFWEATQGGIDGEEEELEDNPGLRELRERETELSKKESQAEKSAGESAMRLQRRYDHLRGGETTRNVNKHKVVSYWANQLMILSVYQTSAPKLLTTGIVGYEGSELEATKVRLYRN